MSPAGSGELQASSSLTLLHRDALFDVWSEFMIDIILHVTLFSRKYLNNSEATETLAIVLCEVLIVSTIG